MSNPWQEKSSADAVVAASRRILGPGVHSGMHILPDRVIEQVERLERRRQCHRAVLNAEHCLRTRVRGAQLAQLIDKREIERRRDQVARFCNHLSSLVDNCAVVRGKLIAQPLAVAVISCRAELHSTVKECIEAVVNNVARFDEICAQFEWPLNRIVDYEKMTALSAHFSNLASDYEGMTNSISSTRRAMAKLQASIAG